MPTATIDLRKPLTVPAAFEHPSLGLPVTDEQRERGISYLQQSYAEGRLTIIELDERVEQVLRATTRRDMNRAFDGLATIPVGRGSSLLRRRPAGQPGALGRGGAALTHFSGLCTFMVGPGVGYAMSSPNSYARREAAKAFNFQVIGLLMMIASTVLLDGPLGLAVNGVVGVSWMLLTIAGAVHAAAGDDWRNPVSRAVPLKLLGEGRPMGVAPRELGR